MNEEQERDDEGDDDEGEGLVDYFHTPFVEINVWLEMSSRPTEVLGEFVVEPVLSFEVFEHEKHVADFIIDDDQLCDMKRWQKICGIFQEEFPFEEFRQWILRLVLRLNSMAPGPQLSN